MLPIAVDSLSHDPKEKSRFLLEKCITDAFRDTKLGNDLEYIWPLL